jgi:hypothetical protein
MSGLPGTVRRTRRQILRRFRLHDLDRSAPLSRQEPQSHVHDPQEVTGEAAAGWTVGRYYLCHKEPWTSSRALR